MEPRSNRGLRLRIARRPSFSLVVAVVALVASVGGNAAAAIVISSNAQVAAHTIAGARAPSGDHQNLIPGSVGTTDVHNGAITALKLAPADRPHKINLLVGGSGTHSTSIVVGELTIKLQCVGTSGGVTVTPTFHTSVVADMNWSYIEDVQGSLSTHVGGNAYSAGGDAQPFLAPGSTPGSYVRREGQVIYSNSHRVVTVTLHLIVSADLNNLCEVTGTAVPASMT